jgi:Rap1a immunity proteins
MTLRQVVQIVISYIDARPERMNESFKKLVIEAIRDAWPCGTNRPPHKQLPFPQTLWVTVSYD